MMFVTDEAVGKTCRCEVNDPIDCVCSTQCKVFIQGIDDFTILAS